MSFMDAVDRHVDPLAGQLGLRAKRHSAIAANIANVDTPEYKAIDVSFEQVLKGAKLKMSATHAGHLAGYGGSADSFGIVEIGGVARPDGNDVNIDNEMVKLAKNQIEFTFLARMLRGKFSKLKEAITGRPM